MSLSSEDKYALLSLIREEGIRLDITLTNSDEVMQLRARVAELEAALDQTRTELHRVEYLFRCETLINTSLHDLCKTHHVKVPKRLFDRPY